MGAEDTFLVLKNSNFFFDKFTDGFWLKIEGMIDNVPGIDIFQFQQKRPKTLGKRSKILEIIVNLLHARTSP